MIRAKSHRSFQRGRSVQTLLHMYCLSIYSLAISLELIPEFMLNPTTMISDCYPLSAHSHNRRWNPRMTWIGLRWSFSLVPLIPHPSTTSGLAIPRLCPEQAGYRSSVLSRGVQRCIKSSDRSQMQGLSRQALIAACVSSTRGMSYQTRQ